MLSSCSLLIKPNGQFSVLILVDILATFVMVSQALLLEVLLPRLQDTILAWFLSYISLITSSLFWFCWFICIPLISSHLNVLLFSPQIFALYLLDSLGDLIQSHSFKYLLYAYDSDIEIFTLHIYLVLQTLMSNISPHLTTLMNRKNPKLNTLKTKLLIFPQICSLIGLLNSINGKSIFSLAEAKKFGFSWLLCFFNSPHLIYQPEWSF